MYVLFRFLLYCSASALGGNAVIRHREWYSCDGMRTYSSTSSTAAAEQKQVLRKQYVPRSYSFFQGKVSTEPPQHRPAPAASARADVLTPSERRPHPGAERGSASRENRVGSLPTGTKTQPRTNVAVVARRELVVRPQLLLTLDGSHPPRSHSSMPCVVRVPGRGSGECGLGRGRFLDSEYAACALVCRVRPRTCVIYQYCYPVML